MAAEGDDSAFGGDACAGGAFGEEEGDGTGGEGLREWGGGLGSMAEGRAEVGFVSAGVVDEGGEFGGCEI